MASAEATAVLRELQQMYDNGVSAVILSLALFTLAFANSRLWNPSSLLLTVTSQHY
ncbi:hypothetical protein N9P82_01215 [bacterium]|nr:hypothetical protein [bacterium]